MLEDALALLTLTLLEIVLGIDNIIFISIVAGKLPPQEERKARLWGLSLAMVMRILLLFLITWIIGLKTPLFSVLGQPFSGRDLILIAGGLFLIAKSTSEIHAKIEGDHGQISTGAKVAQFGKILIQIILLDMVFSFDSILTAVGMTANINIMIIAVIISLIIMMIYSGFISRFIQKHPTLQVLALSFLILIGFMLVIEAFQMHVPKGYIYFAVFFSLVVELINMRVRKRHQSDQTESSEKNDIPSAPPK